MNAPVPMKGPFDGEECPGCGSMPADREAFGQRNAGERRELYECPHCATLKCAMCDMGDDVECNSCVEEP